MPSRRIRPPASALNPLPSARRIAARGYRQVATGSRPWFCCSTPRCHRRRTRFVPRQTESVRRPRCPVPAVAGPSQPELLDGTGLFPRARSRLSSRSRRGPRMGFPKRRFARSVSEPLVHRAHGERGDQGVAQVATDRTEKSARSRSITERFRPCARCSGYRFRGMGVSATTSPNAAEQF
jgi:hypothetical protein